jgi:hypothetical protein
MLNRGEKNPMHGKKQSPEAKNKIRLKKINSIPWNKGRPRSVETRKTLSEKLKGREPWNKGGNNIEARRTIEKINEIYPLFSKIEEMRYNPNKSIKEIQVHCKNHLCKHSKEENGWFTPTPRQTEARLAAVELHGKDNSYFYCSDKCKSQCVLYGLQNDPFGAGVEKSYTSAEYQIFKEHVLERDSHICQFCGAPATDVHHERPQKLEPFFALDPDYAWSCCEKCHYEKGHTTGSECSTGNLASQVCL